MDIVLACVVLNNMLRAQRSGGQVERDLEDEEIPCDLKDGEEGDGHDRTPQQCQGTEGLPEGPVGAVP